MPGAGSVFSLVLVTAFSFLVAVDILSFQDSPELSLKQQHWRQNGDYFTYNANQHNYGIFYRQQDLEGRSVTGDEHVLVVVHGFPTSSYDYEKIWSNLTRIERPQFTRVITWDLLGFGFSDKPLHHKYSIHEQTDIAEALLVNRGVTQGTKVHILCHDYGVLVGLELLTRSISRQQENVQGMEVASICFLNGGLFPETHHALLLQKLLQWPILGPLISKLSNYDLFARNMMKIFSVQPTNEGMEEFWAMVRFNEGNRLLHKLIHYIPDRIAHRERWVATLQANAVPQLVLNGPDDPVSGAHLVERYKELIPNPRVVSLGTGVGHYPQLEAPAAVLKEYQAFLQSL